MVLVDVLAVPAFDGDTNELDSWAAGGVGCCVVTVAAQHSARETIGLIGRWYEEIERRDDLVLAQRSDDVREAAATGKLAVILQFQNSRPLEFDLNLLAIYWRLGVRAIQLAYNQRNAVGDGCEEPGDAGLSGYGQAVVREMNRLGIIVDLSHTGRQTTLDALTRSTRPCIFSHSNARAIHDHPRNIDDEQIRALAANGGIIGVNGIPAFVTADPSPTIDHVVAHISHIVQLVGPDHVCIGTDYGSDPTPAEYQTLVRNGVWDPANYPPPPWRYPEGFANATEFPNLADRLAGEGYDDATVDKIMGGNFLRVFAEVCDD
jgi:membrane dipeptidase